MKKILLALAGLFAADAFGQTVDPIKIEFNDGKVIYPRSMRRNGDTIIATLDVPASQPGGQATRGEFGYQLKDISSLYFPKPAILDAAPMMIATGKAADAVAQLDNALKFYAGFRDVKGSWWDELAPLHIQALLALRQNKEASEASDTFARLATTDENKKISLVFLAIARTQKGDYLGSLPLYDDAYRATKRSDIQGLIAVNKGESLVALGDSLKAKGEAEQADKRYEAALLSFLRVPALYPGQRQFMAQATFGAARAYFGIDDLDRALASIKELRESFAGTPEADACNELEAKVKKRKDQLADPKAAAAAAAAPEPKPES
jgi:tetratricopeptide (TPR) repeat protein